MKLFKRVFGSYSDAHLGMTLILTICNVVKLHFLFFSLMFPHNNSWQGGQSLPSFSVGILNEAPINRCRYNRRQKIQKSTVSRQNVIQGLALQVSSVCLVCGSRRATSPPVSSRADTSKTGTAQLVSTNFPKTMLAMIAATLPTPVKKPRAEDLKERRENNTSTCEELWVNLLHKLLTFSETVKTLADLF